MRGKQLAYSDSYDVANRIMDLNFDNNLKNRYDKLIVKALTFGCPRFDSLVSAFEWNEDMVKYVRGKRPYPKGKYWTKAKRILTVMNMEVKHFRALEILLQEGKMMVYDCILPVFDEAIFFTHKQPLLELFPNLLRQSKLMDHFPVKVLSEI
ncbi:hypothetical protein FXO38_08799 [Capsicum annuum]|nr:hypothetical protein FXO38_08799 [Capsicum annuum]KAF3669385.1 hypothetical protein FXO37_09063 [Capsicum annuum]